MSTINIETPQEHFSDGMRRLSIDESEINYGAEKYRWQIQIANQTTQYSPYPLDLYTNEPYIDIYLPPFSSMEARVMQIDEGSSEWGVWQTFPYQHLTSYDKARILSGEETITSTTTETDEGATIIND